MKILIIACHPDDEIIGCGGTICKHVEEGDSVDVLIITKASSPEWSDDYRKYKKEAQKKIDKFLRINQRHFLNFPSLDLVMIARSRFNYIVYQTIKKVDPDIIYTHFDRGLNETHNIVSLATLVATRIPNNSTIYMYESESARFSLKTFKPNYYVSLTHSELKKKIDAFSFYETEIKKPPHPRSLAGIRTLAKYHGDEVGVKYAEAFRQIRRLWL